MKKNEYVERAVNLMNAYAENDNGYTSGMVKLTADEPVGELRDRIYDTVESYGSKRVEDTKKLYEKVIRNSYSEGVIDGEKKGTWLGAGAAVGGVGIGMALGKIIVHFLKKRSK